MNIKILFESHKSRNIIIAIISLAVVVGIFQAGIFVGFHKASFLFNYGDNYYKAFGENGIQRRGMGMMSGLQGEFTGGHGAVGKIVKVSLPTFVVLGSDNVEKVITTNASTSVLYFRNATTTAGLSVDQYVTILGSPNDKGEIQAKLVRIMPASNMMNRNINLSATSTK